MKQLIFFLIVYFIGIGSNAQNILHSPADYLPADSIMMLAKDNSNLRLEALRVNPTIQPQSLNQTTRKDIQKLLETIKKEKGCLIQSAAFEGLPWIYADIQRLQNAASLLRWTLNAVYADSIENLMFNKLLPALHLPVSENFDAAQALTNSTQTFIMQHDSIIYLNYYANAWIHLAEPDVSLDCITEMPFSPRVKVRIGRIRTQTLLTLAFRIPLWQKAPLRLYVNGRDFEYTTQQGYAIIKRKWNSGDEVYFDLDFNHQIEGHYIRRGPLYYVPNQNPSYPIVLSDSINQYGHLLLRGKNFYATPMMDLLPKR